MAGGRVLSTDCRDEELLYGDEVYDYFLPRSPGLEPLHPSYEIKNDDFFETAALDGKRDFYRYFSDTKIDQTGVQQYVLSNSLLQAQAPQTNCKWDDILRWIRSGETLADEFEVADCDKAYSAAAELYNAYFDMRIPVPPPDSLAPRGRRSKLKWEVPLVLHGAEVAACPDTGSQQNILSKDFARQLGIMDQLDSSHSRKFVLGNGKGVYSLGAIELQLQFAQQPEILLKCIFHVFESLIRPAILGGIFLRHTETMTTYRNSRLRERIGPSVSLPQVLHIGNAGERFRCLVDGRRVDAHADTGSEMDLVSAKFVQSAARSLKRLQTPLPVQFADGSISWISSQMVTRFCADLQQPTSWTSKWFYVLDDLPCDILLGEQTLDELNAFSRNGSISVEITDADGIEICTIFWAENLERKAARSWRTVSELCRRKRKVDLDDLSNSGAEVSIASNDARLAQVQSIGNG